MIDQDRPILFIDDDVDDHHFYQLIFQKVAHTPLILFADGQHALDYLLTTDTKPFLIMAEVRLHKDSGLELHWSEPLRSIPFIFMTHIIYQHLVEEAYELTIQGLFEKNGVGVNRRQLSAIIN